MKIQLTPSEYRILRLLAQGLSYQEIRAKLAMTSANVHTVCQHIRKKTGMATTQDAALCAQFSRDNTAVPPSHGEFRRNPLFPTETQLRALQLLAEGKDYLAIGEALSMGWQTAQNTISMGCRRAGIRNLRGQQRVTAVRHWLENSGLVRQRERTLAADKAKFAALEMQDDPMF